MSGTTPSITSTVSKKSSCSKKNTSGKSVSTKNSRDHERGSVLNTMERIASCSEGEWNGGGDSGGQLSILVMMQQQQMSQQQYKKQFQPIQMQMAHFQQSIQNQMDSRKYGARKSVRLWRSYWSQISIRKWILIWMRVMTVVEMISHFMNDNLS